MSERAFIIVGASVTGAKAAEELRTAGFDGRVLLIGAELERAVASGRTAAGRVIECDFVIVGIGVAPRVEHWANALNQGQAAAHAMLGEPTTQAD